MPRPRTEIPKDTLERLVNTGQKKFIRYNEGPTLYSIGKHSFQKIAKGAGVHSAVHGTPAPPHVLYEVLRERN